MKDTRMSSPQNSSENILRQSLRRILLVISLGAMAAFTWVTFSQSMATQAAQTPTITITPITWDTIGIDSVYTSTTTSVIGPNRYPVGARVCSDQPRNPLVAKFVWVSSNPTNYFDIIGPTVFTESVTASNLCRDYYFTVEVQRTSAAFDTSRLYNIQVTGQNISSAISYTNPRFLSVVRLTRYNNSNLGSMRLYNPSNPTAQTFPLGSLVTYTLNVSNTNPISYSQLVNSLTQSNQLFQLVRVIGRYTNPPNSFSTTAYTDACGWSNNQCTGPFPINFPNGVVGGNMYITYTLRAQTVGTTSLMPLIYGFTRPNTGNPVYQYENNANNSIPAGVFDPNPSFTHATIEKSVYPMSAAVNEIVTYSITVSNTGTTTLQNWTVNDTFPLDLDLLSASSTAGTVSSNTNTKTITVTGTNLAPNATVTITIQCRLNNYATGGTTITNTAFLAYTFASQNYSSSDSAAFQVSGPPAPATTIDKMVSSATAATNDNLTYWILIQNHNPFTLPSWAVLDNLPAVLDILGATSSTGTVYINPATNTVTVSGADLAPSSTVMITIQSQVNNTAVANTTINNAATFAYNYSGHSYIKSDIVGFQVSGPIQLSFLPLVVK